MKTFSVIVIVMVGLGLSSMPSVVLGSDAGLLSPVVFEDISSTSQNAGVCRVLAKALESKRLQLGSLKNEMLTAEGSAQFSGLIQASSFEAGHSDDAMAQHLKARLAVFTSEREYFNGLCVKQTSN